MKSIKGTYQHGQIILGQPADWPEGTEVLVEPIMAATEAPAETMEERFRRLAAAWHRDTDYLSSMEEAESHPAYQEIVRLGPKVVPLLLRDLAENHTHWFGALEAITGTRPVPTSDAGKIPKMAGAWLRWAKDNGYQW